MERSELIAELSDIVERSPAIMGYISKNSATAIKARKQRALEIIELLKTA